MSLKNCPFCGSDEVIFQEDTNGDDYRYWGWEIFCMQDGCEQGLVNEDTEEKAIKAWNTRPREAELEKEIEVLKVLLNKYFKKECLDLIFNPYIPISLTQSETSELKN